MLLVHHHLWCKVIHNNLNRSLHTIVNEPHHRAQEKHGCTCSTRMAPSGLVQSINPESDNDIPVVDVDSDSNFKGKNLALPVTYYVPSSDEECDWDGTVNHCSLALSDSDFGWTDSESDAGDETETEYLELEGEGLIESLQKSLEEELKSLKKLTPYKVLEQDISGKIWKKAEQN